MSAVGRTYGVGTPDTVSMLLIPFGILKAEPMPTWFTKTTTTTASPWRRSNPLFSRGFAGNGLLLIYTVCGTFLSMAFIRYITMKNVCRYVCFVVINY